MHKIHQHIVLIQNYLVEFPVSQCEESIVMMSHLQSSASSIKGSTVVGLNRIQYLRWRLEDEKGWISYIVMLLVKTMLGVIAI